MVYLVVVVIILLVACGIFYLWFISHKVSLEKSNRLGEISEALSLLNIRSEELNQNQHKQFAGYLGLSGALLVHSDAIDYVLLLCIDDKEKRYYQLQYIIARGLAYNKNKMQQVRFSENRKPPILGEVVSLDWSGDEQLSATLTNDNLINDLLIKIKNEDRHFKLWINPSMIGGYAVINTTFYPPTVDSFDSIERIAALVRLRSIDSAPNIEEHNDSCSENLNMKEAIVIGADSLDSDKLNLTSLELEKIETEENK